MTLQFEFRSLGSWRPAQNGIVLADGRLGHAEGTSRPPHWRHAEETTKDPRFRETCFNALSPEERAAAIGRLGRLPTF